MPDAGVIIVEDRGIVIRGNKVAALTSGELAIVALLFRCRPRVMSKEQLLAGLYELEQDEPAAKIIDVWVCKANKQIKPMGLAIKNSWGKGYWLQFGDEVPIRMIEALA